MDVRSRQVWAAEMRKQFSPKDMLDDHGDINQVCPIPLPKTHGSPPLNQSLYRYTVMYLMTVNLTPVVHASTVLFFDFDSTSILAHIKEFFKPKCVLIVSGRRWGDEDNDRLYKVGLAIYGTVYIFQYRCQICGSAVWTR